MKLTPHDLIHGGLYRHKETGDVYRLSLDYPARLEPADGFGIEYELDFFVNLEPIPLTAEILREWVAAKYEGTNDNGHWYSINYGNSNILICHYGNRIYWHYRQSHRKEALPKMVVLDYFHDLQRLYISLTGKPLEGGPHA